MAGDDIRVPVEGGGSEPVDDVADDLAEEEEESD